MAASVVFLDIKETSSWRDYTKPLSTEVQMDLCGTFNIPANDQLCLPGNIVYGPDFYDIMWHEFQPEDKLWATYEEVQAKIGKYQIRLEDPVTQGDGFTYFRAIYDFQGDEVFRVTIFFYENGYIYRIAADLGGS